MDEITQKYQSAFLESDTKECHINISGNVLILTDRLVLLAETLASCIKRISDINIIGIISGHSELETYTGDNIDYLIIAGYLKHKENYEIINELRSKNDNLKTVQWASLDEYIKGICCEYNIIFQFDKGGPVYEFVNYLLEIKESSDRQGEI